MSELYESLIWTDPELYREANCLKNNCKLDKDRPKIKTFKDNIAFFW